MSKLIPTYIEQSVRVEQLERELFAEKEWVRQSTNSNARLEKFLAEAQAEVVRLKGEIDELRAALAEPDVQESLTVAERKPVPEFELIEKWEGE